MEFDHIAITVKKEKLKDLALWYQERMNAKILYLDETWGMLSVCGLKIALVIPSQHPKHIAFNINKDQYRDYKKSGKIFKKHRDGSESFYEKDLIGNILEFLFWTED